MLMKRLNVLLCCLLKQFIGVRWEKITGLKTKRCRCVKKTYSRDGGVERSGVALAGIDLEKHTH